MIKEAQSGTFNSRIRHAILEADWRRIARQLSERERRAFPDNPLFAVNAIAREYGCDLSSVRWNDCVEICFLRHYRWNKVMWTVPVDREIFADLVILEAMLRAMLPGHVAAANDKNTIREYFGPAASR